MSKSKGGAGAPTCKSLPAPLNSTVFFQHQHIYVLRTIRPFNKGRTSAVWEPMMMAGIVSEKADNALHIRTADRSRRSQDITSLWKPMFYAASTSYQTLRTVHC